MKLIKPVLVQKTTRFKHVNLPDNLTNDFAELIGIHFGDGNIHVKESSYRLSYCFNINEKDLIKNTKSLFAKLFEIELKEVQVRNGAILLACHSKPLCYFLKDNFNIPFGKKNNLRIPVNIRSNKEFIKNFLKGLHWTDGSNFIKTDKIKYSYPIVKITTKCKNFAYDIQKELLELGFRATLSEKKGANYHGYDVVLHGKKQYKKWVDEISNKKLIKCGDAEI